ncbi:hypothetical protein LTR66_016519 [Elasticomyces elasticus]|nr:hypothetical protein LTR66_016519 [Elasticomyces elasticus]
MVLMVVLKVGRDWGLHMFEGVDGAEEKRKKARKEFEESQDFGASLKSLFGEDTMVG